MLRNLVIFCLLVSTVGVFFAAKYPMLFKYAATIDVVSDDELLSQVKSGNAFASGKTLEKRSAFKALLADIVQQSHNGEPIFTLDFEKRYQLSVISGEGNCANLVSAISWRLLKKEEISDFNIVHFLPRKSFLRGLGHSVMDYDGIYDVFEGGLWTKRGGEHVILEDFIFSKNEADLFKLTPYGSYSGNKGLTYVSDMVEKNVVGVTPAGEFQRYLDFIGIVYTSFGSEIVEKHLYDFVSLYFGFLPTVFIVTDLRQLTGDLYIPFLMAKFWIFLVRIIPFLIIAFLLRHYSIRSPNRL